MISTPLALKLCGFLYIFILITNAASVGLGNRTGETDSAAMLVTISENPGRYRMGVIVAIASHLGIVAITGTLFVAFSPFNRQLALIGSVSRLGEALAMIYGEVIVLRSVPEHALALKPANVTFEEAAAVPQAAVVVLQGLRDEGEIQPGQKVLINGASGGVGTFAVQIAKSFGAEVTGVCGTRNTDLVRSIGADHVIDYTQEDFTKSEGRYDLILDIVANRPLSDYMRVLGPRRSYVAVAFNPASLFRSSKTEGKKAVSLSHEPNVEDLVYMKELVEAGKVIPVIDRRYPLREVAEAMRYLETGHHHGKVVITMKHNAR